MLPPDPSPAEYPKGMRPVERLLAVLWPAFVMAGVLEMLVFVVVDPSALAVFGAETLDWPRQAVYTVCFFVFWITISAASALSAFLLQGSHSQG